MLHLSQAWQDSSYSCLWLLDSTYYQTQLAEQITECGADHDLSVTSVTNGVSKSSMTSFIT